MGVNLRAGIVGDIHDSAIESIAVQFEMPQLDVRTIYEEQLQRLNTDCRIKAFLPVLCVRHVKQIIMDARRV